jgi:hypothetical protein
MSGRDCQLLSARWDMECDIHAISLGRGCPVLSFDRLHNHILKQVAMERTAFQVPSESEHPPCFAGNIQIAEYAEHIYLFLSEVTCDVSSEFNMMVAMGTRIDAVLFDTCMQRTGSEVRGRDAHGPHSTRLRVTPKNNFAILQFGQDRDVT